MEVVLLPQWAESLQEERLEFVPGIDEKMQKLARQCIRPGSHRVLVFQAEFVGPKELSFGWSEEEGWKM